VTMKRVKGPVNTGKRKLDVRRFALPNFPSVFGEKVAETSWNCAAKQECISRSTGLLTGCRCELLVFFFCDVWASGTIFVASLWSLEYIRVFLACALWYCRDFKSWFKYAFKGRWPCLHCQSYGRQAQDRLRYRGRRSRSVSHGHVHSN
jgi:hypothetical protein